jgi:DNA replication and repair protein RecF
MRLVELKCDGFRSLRDVVFRPGPGINIIRGYNAQGKTTLLEAVYYVATSKSHRTANERELVREGADGFRARAHVQRKHRAVVIEANWYQGVKRFRVNGVAQTRVSDILGKIHVVFFSPEDVQLVKGAAGFRRQFLDMELSQLLPSYLHALQQYRQVLRQRNTLLRDPKADPGLLDVWDEQMALHGALLIEERAKYIEQLDKLARVAYTQIAGEERLELQYQPDVKLSSALGGILRQTRNSDLQRGMTTRGPHRDDFEILIGGRAARSFASQGQQRTATLALKLADVELMKERTGELPVLMLDEVLSELDEKRASRLFQSIQKGMQCLLTTTSMHNTYPARGQSTRYYRIEGGRLEPE